jgi:O-antigen/teichoic acid export membrane protein
MDERKKGLVKNTTILMIGNFSSQILSFILVPIYTHYLLPSEFGEVNVYLTILSMLYILVSLQSIESSFRFIQDCKDIEDCTSTITNTVLTALVGILIFSVIMIIIWSITDFSYSFLFIANVATSIYASQFLHTIRGMNKTTSYVTVSAISTFISALCNIFFVVGMGLGVLSLLITPIIANALVIAIIFYKENFMRYIKFKEINLEVIKKQLVFSLPLIPNAVSLWFLSSIGLWVILFFYNEEAVGLLAFTLKFPMLLGMISGIFHMAWQVSAISQFNADDKDTFASEVFYNFTFLQLTSFILILPALKVLIFTTVGAEYREASIYIPIFMIGILFKAFAQFYNAGFYGAKKTTPIFQSSLIAAFVYLVGSIIFAGPLFILGIAIAYSISEFIRWVIIVRKVSPFMKISIQFSRLIPIIISVILVMIIYYTAGIITQIITFIVGLVSVVVINRKLLSNLLKAFISSVKKQSLGNS